MLFKVLFSFRIYLSLLEICMHVCDYRFKLFEIQADKDEEHDEMQ